MMPMMRVSAPPKDGGEGQCLPGDPAGYLGPKWSQGTWIFLLWMGIKRRGADKPERAL